MKANLDSIAEYVMPSFPARPSDLGFLFGTRHGVPEFCDMAHGLWRNGMFSRLLVSGGRTGSLPLAEADVIAEQLVGRGMPTLQRYWPGLDMSVSPAKFRARVLSEFTKIPRYLAEGFLEEIYARGW